MFAWLTRLFRAPASPAAAQAHLTFGAATAARSLSRTGTILKRQLWIWPILAVFVLAGLGYMLRNAIEKTMSDSLQSQLHTLLTVEVSMLETWLRVQTSNAESLANDPQVRQTVAELSAAKQPLDGAAAPASAAALATIQSKLAAELTSGMASHKFAGFFLADQDFRVIATSHVELQDRVVTEFETQLTRVFDGETIVTPPFASVVMMKDEHGKLRSGAPTMFVCAPVRDSNLQVIAVLGLRIRPEREFTRILQLGQSGATGETYAIDKTGLLVSNSRFDESLILLGLLPDLEGSSSILTLSARDPGGDLAAGFRPKIRRAELPLTLAAEKAIAGEAGVNVAGYTGYRGARVVGAWQWLPKFGIGIITEINYAEAYRPLTILRWAFFSIFGLLALSSIAIFVFTIVVARLQREAQAAAIEAKHLGQYRLEERIGSGAMGVVYRGTHAMLRRPAAIKMLDIDKVNEVSIQRFEREVQITCKLDHPNTIEIYDFGRTPEGVFYYAMEFLDGIDLQQLVDRYGPQPEGRVIHILKQICGSLYEAHTLGLVHRDIKPANVMLNRRGGEPDVVKVLDFGLVRAVDETRREGGGGLAGTPLYMSPEAIQAPDAVDGRSDLYAVGAIGYFLLTGQPVFAATTLNELCQQHLTAVPVTPSQRLGRPVTPEVEAALLACLEKNPARRPQTARELTARLLRAATAGEWSLDEGEAWWGRHERARANGGATTIEPPPRTPASGTRGGFDQTLESGSP